MPIPALDTLVPAGPFPIVNDSDLKGGFRVLDWNSTANPDPTAFLNAQIPAAKRTVGMGVRLRDTVTIGNYLEKLYSGSNVWDDRSFVATDLGFVGIVQITNPNQNTFSIFGATPGAPVVFYTPTGKKVTAQAQTVTIPFDTGIDGSILLWDDSAGVFAADVALGSGLGGDPNDLAIGYYVRPFGVITRFRVFPPRAHDSASPELLIGGPSSGAHFRNIVDALAWRAMYNIGSTVTKTFRVVGDVNVHSNVSVGLVDVSPVGVVTADPSNTTARFRRDLAVGDVVEIVLGGVGYLAKVSGLTSDTQFTITDYGGAAWTVTLADHTCFRLDDSGSYSQHLDCTQPEFSLPARINGFRLFGTGETSIINKPTVTWGGARPTGTTVSATVPFFQLNGVSGFEISDLIFAYNGAYEGGNFNVCWLRNPGKGFLIDGVTVNGGSGFGCLSTVVHFFSDIGGDFTDAAGETAPVIRRSAFTNLYRALTTHFYVGTGTVDGSLKLEDCKFHVVASAFAAADTAFFLYSTVAHNLDVFVDTCRIANIRVAIFSDPSTPPNSVKRIDNTLFGNAAENEGSTTKLAVANTVTLGVLLLSGTSASCAGVAGDLSLMQVSGLAGITPNMVGCVLSTSVTASGANAGASLIIKYVSATTVIVRRDGRTTAADGNNGTIDWDLHETLDVERASLSNCEILDKFDFLGASEVIGCRASAEVTVNTPGAFIGVRFKGGILTRHVGPKRFIPGDAAASVLLGQSQVVTGLEAYPQTDLTGATGNWHIKAVIRVSAGLMVLPNGTITALSGDTDRNLSPGAGAGVRRAAIETGLPIFGGGVAYIYVFLRKKVNEVTPSIEYSLLPPDNKGRPSGAVQTTYTVDDYGYLGMFMAREFYFNNTDAVSPDTNVQALPLWRGSIIQYLATGVRMVTMTDPEDEDTQIAFNNSSPPSGTTVHALVVLGTLFNNTTSRFRTAKFIQVSVTALITTGAGTIARGYLFLPGVYAFHSLTASSNALISASGWLPITANTVGYYAGYRNGSSTVTPSIGNARTLIASIIEDVNRIGGPAVADTRFPF